MLARTRAPKCASLAGVSSKSAECSPLTTLGRTADIRLPSGSMPRPSTHTTSTSSSSLSSTGPSHPPSAPPPTSLLPSQTPEELSRRPSSKPGVDWGTQIPDHG